MFKEMIEVYSENNIEAINTLCGQNADLLNVKAGGACGHHCEIKVRPVIYGLSNNNAIGLAFKRCIRRVRYVIKFVNNMNRSKYS
jgi:hypothetical protein